jgi:hypothetical protein
MKLYSGYPVVEIEIQKEPLTARHKDLYKKSRA